MKQFYAYVHARPDGGVFYVGKGHGKRAQRLSGRSDHHQKTINKYGKAAILIGKIECSSEDIAFNLEKGLIKCFRRMGVALTNKTDGGDGVTGLHHSDETKEKLSRLFDDDGHAEKHSAAVKEAHVRSKEKYRTSARESQNRPEVKAKHLTYQSSPEVVARKSQTSTERWADPNVKLAWRKSINESLAKPETKAKQSKSQKGRIWITNGVDQTKVFPEDAVYRLANGWWRGHK